MSKHGLRYKSNLQRKTSHRMSMLRTMTAQVLQLDAIRTTEVKMKRVRPLVDKMVTLAKKGTLGHRRQAYAFLRRQKLVDHMFATFGARYKDRAGGYTTFARLAPRKGDGAPMVRLMMMDSTEHKLWNEFVAKTEADAAAAMAAHAPLQIASSKQ